MAYKRTDWLDDQILVTGFAAGGLTEVPREQFRTCSMAVTLATELGPFGIKTQVRHVPALAEKGFQKLCWLSCHAAYLPVPVQDMVDLLAGRRVDLRAAEGAYWRSFAGEWNTRLSVWQRLPAPEDSALSQPLQQNFGCD